MGADKFTKDVLTPEGRKVMLEFLALKSKPFVKIGVLQESYEDPKKEDDGKESTETTLGEVATANEFGVDMGGDGGPARHIPERSFIRSTADAHAKGDWFREGQALKEEVVKGKMSVDTALKQMGLRIKAAIQEKIRSMVPPPNAPSTIARKKSDKTLIDTGQLLNSIDYEVHREAE